MNDPALAWVILAAGQGTRLMSAFPDLYRQGITKPFLPIAGRPMIRHLIDAIHALSPETIPRIVIVVSPDFDRGRADLPDHVECAVQPRPDGTGAALRIALTTLQDSGIDTICVLNGDGPAVPIVWIDRWARGGIPPEHSHVLLTYRSFLPHADAMGRYDPDGHRIVENPPEPRPDDLVNTGVYILRNLSEIVPHVHRLVPHTTSKGGQEFYLTDLVESVPILPWVVDDPRLGVRFQGVNTPEEWETVQSILLGDVSDE